MASKAAWPLLIAWMLAGTLGGCRRPEPQTSVDAAFEPAVVTRFLETRGLDSAPPLPLDLKTTAPSRDGNGRREGGVPEALNVTDDCTVHAVWWAAHPCGLTAKGAARFAKQTGWISPSVLLTGAARVDCPAQVTRFETVISGLPAGGYRFGNERKYLELTIRCARDR